MDVRTIMIVEDDDALAQALREYLLTWGYDAIPVHKFSDIVQEYLDIAPQMVLLDVNLPFYDGFYWCQKLRELGDVPIVFISSRNEDKDKIMAIAQGGDDYIEKPFHLELLKVKIDALFRRVYQYNRSDHIKLTANLKFDFNHQCLFYNEQEIELTKSERRIMVTLLQRKGAIVSREELMMALWNTDEFVSDGTLTTLISRLRNKLSAYGGETLIQTKKGMGYRIQ